MKALSLKCISRRGYKFVRDRWNYPLPGLTTLRDWTNGFQTPPGLLELSLKTMESVQDTMPQREKLLVFSFDEMSVDARLCLDQGEDRAYGPHTLVQVLMARSLCSHWKQPIWYGFDQPMTPAVLFGAIEAVERVGYTVVAIVCDLSFTNQRLLWRPEESGGLAIDPAVGSFKHPVDDSR